MFKSVSPDGFDVFVLCFSKGDNLWLCVCIEDFLQVKDGCVHSPRVNGDGCD